MAINNKEMDEMKLSECKHICTKSYNGKHTAELGDVINIFPTYEIVDKKGKTYKRVTDEGELLSDDFYEEHYCRISNKDSEALRILNTFGMKFNARKEPKEMDTMNQELYELALKQLNALDTDKLTDVEVRHVEDPADEYGVKENRIQIDIYYNEVDTKA